MLYPGHKKTQSPVIFGKNSDPHMSICIRVLCHRTNSATWLSLEVPYYEFCDGQLIPGELSLHKFHGKCDSSDSVYDRLPTSTMKSET